ncbi:MAG: hypothetical protein LBQ48_00745 [Oscillospiraceae bacterium]|nr:hypothetical protein [Oscillospiraceae bacterium]
MEGYTTASRLADVDRISTPQKFQIDNIFYLMSDVLALSSEYRIPLFLCAGLITAR